MFRKRWGSSYREVNWRTELELSGGTRLWLVPHQIRNFHEVREFVKQLETYQGEERMPYAVQS